MNTAISFHEKVAKELNPIHNNGKKPHCEKENEDSNHQTIEQTGLLRTITINSSMQEASKRPIPKQIFSEFIHEGEVVILYADTGKGKSILAVQSGDIASRGTTSGPFRYEPDKPKVTLYLDCELSDKQFEGRYSDHYQNHYKFSENFYTSRINPDHIPEGDFETALYLALEKEIQTKEVEFLIIDNLTYLRPETEQSKNALPLMKQLKLLKSKYNLTILVLAHTPKRDASRPIGVNDLAGSKALINFCDAAFAIGESFKDKSLRYIKQIKARATEVVYDSENVLVCEVKKDFNYLKFEHLGYATEKEHLKPMSDDQKKVLEDNIIELHQKGHSEREIVAVLGENVVNKSKVHRVIQKHKESGSSEPSGSYS